MKKIKKIAVILFLLSLFLFGCSGLFGPKPICGEVVGKDYMYSIPMITLRVVEEEWVTFITFEVSIERYRQVRMGDEICLPASNKISDS